MSRTAAQLFATVVLLSGWKSQATNARNYLLPEGVSISSYERLTEFRDALTTVIDATTGARAVQSSGGAAGGVVSEGQGYGLFIGGSVVASMRPSNPNWQSAVNFTYQIFLGWRKMCKLTDQGSCQQGGYTCGGRYPCLPNWKFNSDIRSAVGTGSAPDGDEDGILGMILLVTSTKNTGYERSSGMGVQKL